MLERGGRGWGGLVQRGGDQPVTGSAASRVITRDQALSPFAISRRMPSCLVLSKSCCAYKPWEGRGGGCYLVCLVSTSN